MFRIVPAVGAESYQTFEIRRPLATHWRTATCEEVDCPNAERGWRTVVDESTELGQRQAHYIRRQSGRLFREERQPDGTTAFLFASGQPCFQQHRVQIGRPELYVVRGGDWRGNPRGLPARQHTRPDLWVEEFGEHQERIAEAKERG